jgi:putative endopeptidase
MNHKHGLILSGLLCYVAAGFQLLAQTAEHPLTSLPYTPSLDTRFMDKTVDPCSNFYQYACGNWNKLNPIPADQARWDVYSKVADDNSRLLWGLLDKYSQPATERTANEQKIGDLFHACMDTASVDAAGTKPLAESLKRIAEIGSSHDVAAYVAFERRNGISMLFDFDAAPDLDNSSLTMADVGAGGLGLPDRDYYTKTDSKSQQLRQKYV